MISTFILFVILVIGGAYTFRLSKKTLKGQDDKQTQLTIPTLSLTASITNSPVVSPITSITSETQSEFLRKESTKPVSTRSVPKIDNVLRTCS